MAPYETAPARVLAKKIWEGPPGFSAGSRIAPSTWLDEMASAIDMLASEKCASLAAEKEKLEAEVDRLRALGSPFAHLRYVILDE